MMQSHAWEPIDGHLKFVCTSSIGKVLSTGALVLANQVAIQVAKLQLVANI